MCLCSVYTRDHVQGRVEMKRRKEEEVGNHDIRYTGRKDDENDTMNNGVELFLEGRIRSRKIMSVGNQVQVELKEKEGKSFDARTQFT